MLTANRKLMRYSISKRDLFRTKKIAMGMCSHDKPRARPRDAKEKF